MWTMHQRYEDRYGRVRTPDDHTGGHPLTGSQLSALEFIGILFAALLWIAVCFIYIPEHTVIQDNHFLPLFAGYYLVLRSLRPPNRTTRIVYLAGALPLIAATLLPLVYPDPWTVALANYGGLGAVVAGIGAYNHRLLTNTFGPLDADTDSTDEPATAHG